MGHYGHDMDHDGKITGKDTAMFHEMMEEDARAYKTAPAGHPEPPAHPWTKP